MPYHRARVRSNEVGRNNAEEGGRDGGKNDERIRGDGKRKKLWSPDAAESRSDCRTGRRRTGGRPCQSSPTKMGIKARSIANR